MHTNKLNKMQSNIFNKMKNEKYKQQLTVNWLGFPYKI